MFIHNLKLQNVLESLRDWIFDHLNGPRLLCFVHLWETLIESHWVCPSSPVCGSLVDHKGAEGIAHVNSQWLVMPIQALLTTHSLLVPPQLPGHLLDWPLDADWPSSATFLWISSIYWLGDLSWLFEVREDVRYLFTQLPLHEVFLCLTSGS